MAKALTIAEVAEHLQVTRQTVHNWIKSGQLRSAKLGRVRRILESDLERFVMSGMAGGPAQAAA